MSLEYNIIHHLYIGQNASLNKALFQITSRISSGSLFNSFAFSKLFTYRAFQQITNNTYIHFFFFCKHTSLLLFIAFYTYSLLLLWHYYFFYHYNLSLRNLQQIFVSPLPHNYFMTVTFNFSFFV